MFYVYILYSSVFDRYYVGQTNDMKQRLNRHNNGHVPSTAPYRPWIIRLSIQKEIRSEAVILENKLKNLSRERLIQFIAKYSSPRC